MVRWLLVCGMLAWAGAAQAGDQPSYGPPEDWVKPLAIPKGDASADGAPTQVVLYELQAKLGPAGDEYFVDRATKVLAPEGLTAAGEVTETWDPDTDDLVIHHLHVIRGGQVIDALAGGQKMLVLRRENKLELAMLDGRLTATLEPEGLQVGDVVDFSYTLKHHDPALKGFSEDVDRLDHTGVAKEIYWREFWPAAKPMRWRTTEGVPAPVVTKTADGSDVTFDMRDVQTPKPPQGAPARFFDLGSVEYSQYADWAQLSGLLSPLYDKAATLAADSPLRAEVARIAAASQDPKTRAAAALRLVEEQTRYVFLGMNDGGLVPADADATWARRFGDCKGKTALLTALLRALGVTAEPALVSTTFGDGMDQRLPMTTWFDHVIVRAEIAGKTYWLDATRIGDRDLDALTIPSYHWALPVRPTGAALIKLDPPPLALPGTEVTLKVDASKGPDTPAPTHIEILYRGEDAATLRQTLASVPRSDYERYLRDFWTKANPWFDVQTVAETDDPVTGLPKLSADGAGKLDWSTGTAGERYYRVPHTALGADISFKRQPGPNQDAPYAVSFPYFSTQTWRITLPADGAFVIVGSDVDTAVAGEALKRTSRIEGGVLTVAISVKATEPEFPAAEADNAGSVLRDLAKNGVAVAYRVGPPPPAVHAANANADLAAAQGGDAAAQYRLGIMYAQGLGVPFDKAQAMSWFQKAAAQGHAGAEAAVGGSYLRGDAVAQDYAQALVWLRKAADQNNADAEADLGFLYLSGKGPARDGAQALALFRKAADQDNANGEFGLASMYLFGQDVAKDPAQAFVWMQKSANHGMPRAEGQLGAMYAQGYGVAEDDTQAIHWQTKGAAAGDTEAMRMLGWAYQHGHGVPLDYAQAMTWYRKSADAGDADADFNIAVLYLNGWGAPRDPGQAVDWYRKAADQGSIDGENAVGILYKNGIGVPRDYALAMAWFQKAAAQGDAKAENSMAVMYENGEGVARDMDRALGLYRDAASKNNSNAQYNLGLAYLNGRGVKQDNAQALTWLQKAAAQNDSQAEEKLGELYAGGIAVPQDRAAAVDWFRKSAAQDNALAERNLALAYLSGQGVGRDRAQALAWFDRAAALGDEISRIQAAALRGGPSASAPSPNQPPRN